MAHDSHNIIVAGTNDDDLMTAARAVAAMQGGLVAVMGGQQAARVLSTVGGPFKNQAERDTFEAPILETYEREGSPYFATARLWDDGVIDPAETRQVLGLALSVVLNAPAREDHFGVFRM